MRKLISPFVGVLAFWLTGIAGGNLLQNGSFEAGPEPGDYLPLNPGNTAINGWTVISSSVPNGGGGGIDYYGTGWRSSDGSRSLDLNDTPGVGGVFQDFATTPGVQYAVSFDFAGHPSGLLQEMKVSAISLGNAAPAQETKFSFQAGTDPNNLGWQKQTWEFTAKDSQTRLQFESLQTGYRFGGPALDNVDVNECTPTITSGGAVDIMLIVDLSKSFTDDLPGFQAQASDIISTLHAANPNIRFGLGIFEDYPVAPFGDLGDKAYERLVDLTADSSLIVNTIAGLSIGSGGDDPESQLVALFQAAKGTGQDLSGVGYPLASIPAGQQANFRKGAAKLFLLWTDNSFHQPGDSGLIPYPGPSSDETLRAIQDINAKVLGITSGGGGASDLKVLARGTGALAPTEGVDCNNDGNIDIPAGEPLVCNIASSGEGIAEAIVTLIGSVTNCYGR